MNLQLDELLASRGMNKYLHMRVSHVSMITGPCLTIRQPSIDFMEFRQFAMLRIHITSKYRVPREYPELYTWNRAWR